VRRESLLALSNLVFSRRHYLLFELAAAALLHEQRQEAARRRDAAAAPGQKGASGPANPLDVPGQGGGDLSQSEPERGGDGGGGGGGGGSLPKSATQKGGFSSMFAAMHSSSSSSSSSSNLHRSASNTNMSELVSGQDKDGSGRKGGHQRSKSSTSGNFSVNLNLRATRDHSRKTPQVLLSAAAEATAAAERSISTRGMHSSSRRYLPAY
jgi:hypothetical protein